MRTAFTLLLFVVALAIRGQGRSVVSAYTTQQGLPSNLVCGIAEDLDGRLWVSTDNGLCLFRDPGEPERGVVVLKRGGRADAAHPVSNDLNMVYADRHEPVLWIATRSDGLDAFHYRTATFEHFPLATASPGGARQGGAQAPAALHDASVTGITPDGAHALWLTSWMGGFTCMDKRARLFLHFGRHNLPQLPNDSLWCLLPLSRGGHCALTVGGKPLQVSRLLAVGHVNRGLTLVDLGTRRCHNYPIVRCFKARYVAEDGVRAMVADGRGNLWLGTEKGLALFDMKHRRAIEVPGVSGLVNHLSLQGDSLRVSTRDMGLLTLSVSDYYRHSQRPVLHAVSLAPTGLNPSLAVTTTYADRSGHLWIGTLEEGLLLFRPNPPLFRPLSLPSAIHGNVTALLALSPRDVWVGTYQNGLYRWDPHTNRCHALPLVDGNGGRRIFVNGLALWRGRVAVATGQGLFVVSPSDERFTCHTWRDAGITGTYLLSVAADRHGRLWCGGADGGLDVIDSTLKSVASVSKQLLGSQRAVAHLAPCGPDRMAASVGSGLVLLSAGADAATIRPIPPDSSALRPLSATVTALSADSKGRLLYFTPGGIYRLGPGGTEPYYLCQNTDSQASVHVAAPMPDGTVLMYGNRKLFLMVDGVLPDSPSPAGILRLVLILVAVLALALCAVGVWLWRRRRRKAATSSLSAPTPSQPTPVSLAEGQAPLASESLSAEDRALIDRLGQTVARMDTLAPLNRDTLASAMCMSTSTLYRRMKQALSLSPNEWIRIQRLERAKVLLEQGHNVSETAALVGLDSAYLARCYKERFGVYPSEVGSGGLGVANN